MTLPKDVAEAVDRLDNAVMFRAPNAVYDAYRAIRTHLLSQDTEMARKSEESTQQFIRGREWAELSGRNERRYEIAESRLAAANALLSRCFVQIGELTKGLDPHDSIYTELQRLGLDWMQHSEAGTAHIPEATHDHA